METMYPNMPTLERDHKRLDLKGISTGICPRNVEYVSIIK